MKLTLVSILSVSSMALLLASTASAHYHQDECEQAYRECEFRFDSYDNIPTFSLAGKADVPFTTAIVSKNAYEILGVLNTNHIAPEVVLSHDYKPITALYASPSLTPTHIKPLSIPYGKGSGLGHQVLTTSQKNALSNQCIRVFFTSYQVLNYHGHVVENANYVPRNKNKCVVFRSM